MNSAEKPHRDADFSVISVLRRSLVFRISKPFLSKSITPSKSHEVAFYGQEGLVEGRGESTALSWHTGVRGCLGFTSNRDQVGNRVRQGGPENLLLRSAFALWHF
jgi:hypothetical protein